MSFCMLREFFPNSEMYCSELVMTVDWRIRFRVWARLVPRCGVARNVIAVTALIIGGYAGSCWPCIYAYKVLFGKPGDNGSMIGELFLTSLTISPPKLWTTKIRGTYYRD